MTTKQAIEQVLKGSGTGCASRRSSRRPCRCRTSRARRRGRSLLGPLRRGEEAGRARHADRPGRIQAQPEAQAGEVVTAAKLCTCGRPMLVELNRALVGGNGKRVVLWYCETCDHAEHEVRQA